ncbi:MAG: hypothetical protein KF851_05350 [Pirellulaceae bacterium]|nr:hypothetical protein [Pirellulaceae bacterium]
MDYNGGNFRLRDNSPVRNLANPANLVLDDFDLDDDGNTSEPLPDADLLDRIVGSGPDLGAFENQTV